MSAQASWLPEPAPVPAGSSDEFFTPPRFFAAWDAEFRFTIDVCATAESAKCERFFSPEQDGLAQAWRGERCWMNPPYSDIAPWAAKARQEMEWGGCQLVVALLPAWTDRAWWHTHVEPWRHGRGVLRVELRFVRGRIAFGYPGNPEGLHAKGGTFPSVLVIWRRAAS